MLPAHETKNVPVLHYTINGHCYTLHQSDSSGETGSTLWLSTQILATHLVALYSSSSDGKRARRRARELGRVLELGSGIGLLALVVRDLHYTVTASDYSALLPLLQRNIHLNPALDGSIDVKLLDWTSDTSTEVYDTILMADVIYVPDLLVPLYETLLRHSRKGTLAYLAQEVRTPHLLQEFLALCSQEFKVTSIPQPDIAEIEAMLKKSQNQEAGLPDGDEQTEAWSGVAIYKLLRK